MGAGQERRLVPGVVRSHDELVADAAVELRASTISLSGRTAASGIGYGAPAAIGAALANKKHGRLTINIQNDGDLNYAPGVLWTAAHHKIPLLNIMHNNRAYHEERMYIQMFGAKFNRGVENGDIGTALVQPRN